MAKNVAGILACCLLCSIWFFSSPSATYACSCAGPPSVQEAFDRGTAVFAGKVVDIANPKQGLLRRSSADPLTVSFEVTDVWKGSNYEKQIVYTAMSSASCGFEFQLYTDYLVYGYEDESGLQTGLCGRTKTLLTAAQDLAVLGMSQKPVKQQVLPESTTNRSLYWIAAAVMLVLIVIVTRTAIRKRRRKGVNRKL